MLIHISDINSSVRVFVIINSKMLCLYLVVASVVTVTHGQVLEGLLALDKVSFDKIVTKFDYSLIKFDVGYPTGDKHKNYGKLVKEV